MPEPLSSAELGRLKWRCRRGLLENDLFIERFFAAHEGRLERWHADGLAPLIDLPDNDLLDLLLRRTEPAGDLARREVVDVLALLRRPPAAAAPAASARQAAPASPPRHSDPDPPLKETP